MLSISVFIIYLGTIWASVAAQMLKILPWMWATQVPSLGQKDPLEKKWQPTLVFLPGESPGRGTWQTAVHGSHKELDTTEWLTLFILTMNNLLTNSKHEFTRHLSTTPKSFCSGNSTCSMLRSFNGLEPGGLESTNKKVKERERGWYSLVYEESQ